MCGLALRRDDDDPAPQTVAFHPTQPVRKSVVLLSATGYDQLCGVMTGCAGC